MGRDSEQPRIFFAHRLLRARDWQDRPEQEQVCDWWRGRRAGVCALVGIGGAGKTAIADRFLRRLPGVLSPADGTQKDDTLMPPRQLFVFSFYDAPNPDDFFGRLAAWLRDEPFDEAARTPSYEQTLMLLAKARGCLLVMDGLEKAQSIGIRGSPLGHITDGRLRDLVLRAADGYMPGLAMLITTRFRLFDPLAERSPDYYPIAVEKLAPETCVALLRQRGVSLGTADGLRAIARDQGFHALSVDLIGGYIAYFCDGDPAQLPPEPRVPADDEDAAALDPRLAAIREQNRKFDRLAERYREVLSKSDPATLALLQRVCLFRLGVGAEALASIFTGEGKEGVAGDLRSPDWTKKGCGQSSTCWSR